MAPLLFVIFHSQLNISIAQLGSIAALNFGVQLLTDLAAMTFVDRVGYRVPMVAAHAFAAMGLVLLGVLPVVMSSPFLGLCLAVIVYAIGGGLLEVLVSPVVEHLPTPADSKATGMALLHSFYCWGQVAVVVVTTLLLSMINTDWWPLLPILWSIVPLLNLVAFLRVPLPATVAGDVKTRPRKLLAQSVFLAALVLMMTGGAAELTMAQWASFFAEAGIGVSKEMGDLLGPGLFALLMGMGRFAYGLWGARFSLERLLVWSAAITALCYVVAATSPLPIVSLLACAFCGLGVSLLWPGTFSLTSARFPLGGASMFALLALAGDAGGALGPLFAGGLAGATDGVLAPLASWLPPDGNSGLRVALLLCALIPTVFAFTVVKVARKPVEQQS